MPIDRKASPSATAAASPLALRCRCLAILSWLSGSVSAISASVAPCRRTMTVPPARRVRTSSRSLSGDCPEAGPPRAKTSKATGSNRLFASMDKIPSIKAIVGKAIAGLDKRAVAGAQPSRLRTMEVSMRGLSLALGLLAALSVPAGAQESTYYDLARGDYPHDVAVGPQGEVWFAGQKAGIAGRLDPNTRQIERIALGKNAAPHGVIVGPDGAPWFTDGGQNAIVRVDPLSRDVKAWPLPPERMPYTNLNTAAFDGRGRIWFTGQNGI